MQYGDIVNEELSDLAQRIADNIARNGQAASGRTQQSLHVVEDDDSVTLYGREGFHSLERGVSPEEVKKDIMSFSRILYLWSQDKGISFSSDKERSSFAYLLARKIKREGTALYRDGGRADVYSNEIPTTVQRIRQRISAAFRLMVESININKPNAADNS